MIHSGLQPFDFRKHAALGDTAVSLRNWVAKSSSFFSDFWAQASDYDAQLSAGTMETHSYADVLENMIDKMIDARCALEDRTEPRIAAF